MTLLLIDQARLIPINVFEKNDILFEYKHFRLTNEGLVTIYIFRGSHVWWNEVWAS